MRTKLQARRRILGVWDRFQFALNVTLFCLIIGAFGISTFIGTQSLVNRDLQARLDMEAMDIHRAFVDRVQTYSDTILNLKAFMGRMGVRSSQDFKTLLSEMKVFDYYSGVSAVAVSVVYPEAEREKYEKLLGVKFHGSKSHVAVEENPSKVGAAMVIIEPETVKTKRAYGFNSFSEPVRREFFERAIALNTTVLTPPVTLLSDQLAGQGDQNNMGFVLLVPFQTKNQLLTIPPSEASTTGVISASFRFKILIDEIFGSPSLDREHWNFILSTKVNGEDVVLYNRFSPDEEPEYLASVQQFSLYGQTYDLKVVPLPSFYKNTDRYLPILAAIGVLLVGSLMLMLYRSTLNQLKEEKVARLKTRRTHEKLRQQTTLLSKLNRFGMTISKQFDPEIVLQKFFEFGEKEDFEFVSILREDEDSKELVLITPIGQTLSNIQISQVNELFGAVNRIGRSDLDHYPEFLNELRLNTLADWQMIRVKFNQRSTFLIIGLRSEAIEEADIELMKSTFSQLVVALETAVLLQRAEEGSRLKTAFLANMSHEIRTPLNAILGFTQILAKSHTSDDKRTQLVENIEKNTGLLTRLIDDILDIAKVEAGKIDIVFARTSFESLLRETRDVFVLKAQEKEIRFNLELKTQAPRFVKTDEYRFKQIIYNLISNAVKFTDRGQVTVRVYSEMKENVARLKFEIEDTGVGIPKGLQDKLFTAFYQGDLSTTRRFGGSGLGLTLSRRLAGEMNGDISLMTSEPGKGSIFCFQIDCLAYPEFGFFGELSNELEVPSTPAPRALEAAPKQRPLQGKNVLLVEDSEDNQIIFTHFLEQAGANVLVASDGNEALVQARGVQDLDLILMDIQIPFIDGREVTRTLRREGYDLPIIALTAHALESEKRSCREAGCDDQITKPATYNNFIRTIQDQLERRDEERKNIRESGAFV